VVGFRVLILTLVLVYNASAAQNDGTIRLEEDDPSITYSGNWYVNEGPANSQGAAALTNSNGARAVVTFTGSGIRWIGVGDRWNGLATVTLDGETIKVDGWSDTTTYQMTLYTVDGLAEGPHKLSIEINHERGPNGEGSWVWIDAFDVRNGDGLPGGLPAATVGRVENDDPAITYTGIWHSNTTALHSGGSAVLAVNAGSAASLTFNGTGVIWITYRDEWSGLARIVLDGEVKGLIDAYLLTGQPRTVAYTVEDLPAGNHSLRIEATGTHNNRSGGSWIWLDAFDVIGADPAGPPAPTLQLDRSSYCVGDIWTVTVGHAEPGRNVRLVGSSNEQPWVIDNWARTDSGGGAIVSGSFEEKGVGSHTVTVDVDGRSSRTVGFVVSRCAP